jgi:hypothetical protein
VAAVEAPGGDVPLAKVALQAHSYLRVFTEHGRQVWVGAAIVLDGVLEAREVLRGAIQHLPPHLRVPVVHTGDGDVDAVALGLEHHPALLLERHIILNLVC